MTHLHFTLKTSELQNLIHQSVKDDISKKMLITIFNQFMENQRTQHIRANEYERSDNRTGQRNSYYERKWTKRIETLELKVPRTRDGISEMRKLCKAFQLIRYFSCGYT